MRILMLSDIHANYEALKVLADEIENADHIFCLGDIVGYHSQVNEVIDCLRQLNNLTCILGNHDDFLLRGSPQNLAPHVKQWIDYANHIIRPDNRNWLSTLPITWGGFIDKVSFLLVHGSPWNPFTDYLYADNPILANLDSFNYDVIAFGQTHRALIQNDKKPFLINPGSIGQSRDKKGLACAIQIETETMSITKIERPFLIPEALAIFEKEVITSLTLEKNF